MKPHVARFEDVEAKERLFAEDIEGGESLLLSLQRREGENGSEMMALILTDERMQSNGGVVYEEERNESHEEGDVGK